MVWVQRPGTRFTPTARGRRTTIHRGPLGRPTEPALSSPVVWWCLAAWAVALVVLAEGWLG